jgi:predicted metal-binding membrane protein
MTAACANESLGGTDNHHPGNDRPQNHGLPASTRSPERASYAIASLIFLGAAAATLYFNYSMSHGSMAAGMSMPGHWTMSMMWMPMGSAFESAAIFALMWLAMMIAMMLPSAMPMLLLYRRAAAFRSERHLGRAVFALGSGYFFVWTLFGVAAYLIGTFISRGAMRWDTFSRALPLAGGLALCIAGVYQLTPWKSACLNHCRDPLGHVAQHLHDGLRGALCLGIHHGAFCAACCWALMLIQLVLGVMNLGVMIVVAVVIALEKMLARGEWIAKATGVAAICGGVAMAILSLRGM